MAGEIITTPSTGAAWPNVWQQVEYGRKGKMGLSLTNWDNSSLPAVASGSWAEVAGSIYTWSSEEAISGTPSSDNINYIKLVPSGTGEDQIVTATWTTDAPTWSDSYQGYYDGTSRYVGGCYYDGADYTRKFLYGQGRLSTILDSNIKFESAQTRYYVFLPIMTADDGWTATDARWDSIQLPHDAIVTEFSVGCHSHSSGSVTLSLQRNPIPASSSQTMASVTVDGTGTFTDSSINFATIDNDDYHYYVKTTVSSPSSIEIGGILITYTILEPKP